MKIPQREGPKAEQAPLPKVDPVYLAMAEAQMLAQAEAKAKPERA